MSKAIIRKERTHLFAPDINIAYNVLLKDKITFEALKEAVIKAARSNAILGCSVELSQNGEAYLVLNEEAEFSVELTQSSFEAVVRENEKIPFDLKKGGLIRFYCNIGKDSISLYIIMHHLAGDGGSGIYLIGDILKALDNNEVVYKPLELCSPEVSDEKCRLNPFVKMMVKRADRMYKKTGKVFTFTDYAEMFASYHNANENKHITAQITDIETAKIKEFAHENGVTVNSIITTAFIKAAKAKTNVGIPVSIRKTDCRFMGNYATGINIDYSYDNKKSRSYNIKNVHKAIYGKLNDENKKYFLMKFMNALSPVIIDSAYFAAFAGYKNKAAEAVKEMFGYTENPQGITVTNLGNVLGGELGGDILDDVMFLPPLVPNVKRMIGVLGINGHINISMNVRDNQSFAAEKSYFESAVEFLKSF